MSTLQLPDTGECSVSPGSRVPFATSEFAIVRKGFGASQRDSRSVLLRDMLNKAATVAAFSGRDGRESNINVNATVLYAN